jgi:membrane associated rhomboid family serine protease
MFLHGNLLHLAGNMWFLWIFGNNVEEAYGWLGYVAMYLVAGLAGTAAFVLLRPDDVTPLIGASGAIAGVLGAYFVLYPRHLVVAVVFFYLVPVPAMIFLGLWFLGQFLVTDLGVAWEAHAGGFAFGALVSLPFRAMLLRHDERVRRAY